MCTADSEHRAQEYLSKKYFVDQEWKICSGLYLPVRIEHAADLLSHG